MANLKSCLRTAHSAVDAITGTIPVWCKTLAVTCLLLVVICNLKVKRNKNQLRCATRTVINRQASAVPGPSFGRAPRFRKKQPIASNKLLFSTATYPRPPGFYSYRRGRPQAEQQRFAAILVPKFTTRFLQMVAGRFVSDPQFFQVSGISVVHVSAVGRRIVHRRTATPLDTCVEQILNQRPRRLDGHHLRERLKRLSNENLRVPQ